MSRSGLYRRNNARRNCSPASVTIQHSEEEEEIRADDGEEDDFSMFYQIANSPSRSSSENISPEMFDSRPRSKSVMYENTNNLLPPDQLFWRRSPSPSRKSLGTLPVIKTMLKIDEFSSAQCSSHNSRRPSLSPMKMDEARSDDEGPVDRADDNGAAGAGKGKYTDDNMCYVRSFKITEKGMVNEGDSLVSRSADTVCMNTSVQSQKSNLVKKEAAFGSSRSLQIQILGASGVGKTTLASQFMTSEQICCRMMSVNEETEKLFSVRIDGKEWNVLLHDTINSTCDSELRIELLDKMDAYIILFAIDDLASFDCSKQILSDIIKELGVDSLVFLVGNKADLERSREVKTKVAKHVAKIHRCKFSEISTALNHRVDDLLCSIMVDTIQRYNSRKPQCRFNDIVDDDQKKMYSSSSSSSRRYTQQRRESQLLSTGRALSRLLRKTFNTKSCEQIT